MSHTYVLVNPLIKGKLKTNIKAKNSLNAAKTLYKSLSEHFNNNVPQFYFTIQKGSSGKGKYYHFEVKESRSAEDVSFQIEQFTSKVLDKTEKQFTKKLTQFNKKFDKQHGGNLIGGKKKRKSKSKSKSKKDDDDDDSSSSESSSDSDDYLTAYHSAPVYEYPIYHWWYDPYVYSLDYLYVPTFYSYLTPYLEIRTRP